jgi:hypothetical protein
MSRFKMANISLQKIDSIFVTRSLLKLTVFLISAFCSSNGLAVDVVPSPEGSWIITGYESEISRSPNYPSVMPLSGGVEILRVGNQLSVYVGSNGRMYTAPYTGGTVYDFEEIVPFQEGGATLMRSSHFNLRLEDENLWIFSYAESEYTVPPPPKENEFYEPARLTLFMVAAGALTKEPSLISPREWAGDYLSEGVSFNAHAGRVTVQKVDESETTTITGNGVYNDGYVLSPLLPSGSTLLSAYSEFANGTEVAIAPYIVERHVRTVKDARYVQIRPGRLMEFFFSAEFAELVYRGPDQPEMVTSRYLRRVDSGSFYLNAENIGEAALVKGNVTVLRKGVEVTLRVGDLIFEDDVVETKSKSFVKIVLNDTSTYTIGPDSKIHIVPFQGQDSGFIDLIKGLIRKAVTGGHHEIIKRNIRTPNATWGSRGTIFDVHYSEKYNSTFGRVTEGIVDAKETPSGIVTTMVAGDSKRFGNPIPAPTTPLKLGISFGSPLTLSISGEPGALVRLKKSANLVDWEDWGELVVLDNDPSEMQESATAGGWFYRAEYP